MPNPSGYRDDLGAALARLDTLEPKKKAVVALPTKTELFRRVRDSFVSKPERWTRHTVRLDGGTYQDTNRDGWVRDFAATQKTLGFYLTGFWWIRVGTVTSTQYGRAEVGRDRADWVYIFCPRFRRTVRKHRNWRLLKDLEEK